MAPSAQRPLDDARPRLAPAAGPGLAKVVLLGQETAGPPLVFIHASDGSALPYLALARQLGDGQRCLGVEASWPDWPAGGAAPDRGAEVADLDDLADGYAEEIIRACGRGPYQLAGWSLGGALAFAVAVALRARRQRVAMLALIDPVSRLGRDWPQDRAATLAVFAQSAAQSVGIGPAQVSAPDLRGLSLAEQDRRVLGSLASAGVIPAGTASISLARVRMLTFESLLTALAAWCPGQFDGRIDVLLPAERPADDLAREWASLTTGPTVTHRVGGDHYTMLRPPLVGQVARVFTRLLRAAAGLP
jgi:thioesterase domain-containing protein